MCRAKFQASADDITEEEVLTSAENYSCHFVPVMTYDKCAKFDS